MRVGLIGGVNSSFITLKKLVEHEFDVVVVFGYKPSKAMVVSSYNDLEYYSRKNNLNFYPFTRINEQSRLVKEANLDVLFVVGISQLISDDIINAPRLGCIGFHPTMLPKGRGRAPLAWLVKNLEHGAATFFQITNTPDAGPIFVQKSFKTTDEDDAGTVESKILDSMSNALDQWLPELKLGLWNPINQVENEVTEYGVRRPEDGLINWLESATSILRLIRASAPPHPGAYSYFGLEKIIVNKARLERNLSIEGCVGRVLKIQDEEYLIQTGEGLIWISSLVIQGERPKIGSRLGYLSDFEINNLKKEIQEIKKYLGILDE